MSTESSSAALQLPPRTIVHWTDEELNQLKPWVEDRNQKVDDIARRYVEVHPHRQFEAVRQKVYKMRRQLDGGVEPIRRSSMPPAGNLTSMLPPPSSLPPPAAVPQANGAPRKSTMRPGTRSASTVPPATSVADSRMTLELPNGARARGTVEQIAALLQRLEAK